MKLSELKEIIDMLDPDCEVKVAPPRKENDKHPIGFAADSTLQNLKSE